MIGLKVPGCGNPRSRVLLCGEGPGKVEAQLGKPFCGLSGSELDYLYLRRAARLNRDDLWVTNIVKWRTDEKDSDPTAEDIARDEQELIEEIHVVDPEIIVAIGRIAACWFMQTDDVDLEKFHGIPIKCPRFPDKKLIITYHPAAGIRQSDRYMHQIFWDFQQVGRLVRGEIRVMEPEYNPRIELALYGDWLVPILAIDTEGRASNPWCMSASSDPAYGEVVKANSSISITDTIVIEAHNLLYDVVVMRSMGIDLLKHPYDDSMLMAHLFPWLPKKLKPLMFKLCGMEQRTYKELIQNAQQKNAKEYLEKILSIECRTCRGSGKEQVPYKRNPNKFRSVKCSACKGDGTSFPQPEPILSFDGDTFGSVYKPRSVGRSIRAAFERGVDLYRWWQETPYTIRKNPESQLGLMPEATLDDVPTKEAVDYAGIDACGTRAVCIKLKKMIKEYGLQQVYDIDKSIIPIIDRMQTNGIMINKPYYQELDSRFNKEQLDILDKLYDIAGHPYNPASPLQVSNLLYKELGCKQIRGSDSTDEKTLETVKMKYSTDQRVADTVDGITEYREIDKLRSTYLGPLCDAADRNDRVHTSFLLHVVPTGRPASRNPNLLNIPVRSDRGKLVKSGFIPKSGCSFVGVDLDQIELRVAAHLSEDSNLIDIFQTGRDIHRATASLVYEKPEEDITEDERRLSKRINFGVLYGMSANRLYKELTLMGLSVTQEMCFSSIGKWFQAYPGVKEYENKVMEQALSVGYVECLFGRRRYVPGVWSTAERIQEESKRYAFNHPFQATAAGINKLWMAGVWNNVLPKVQKFGYCEPVLTVYDSLVLEVEFGLEELVVDQVVLEAENCIELLVPIKAKGASAMSLDLV